MRHEQPLRARFWEYVNGGHVRLSLRDGQTLAWCKAWSHSEGWSSVDETWQRNGATIHNHSCNDGRDCDGRFAQFSHTTTDVHSLTAGQPLVGDDGNDIDGLHYPAWERESAGQYDQYAEMAGY